MHFSISEVIFCIKLLSSHCVSRIYLVPVSGRFSITRKTLTIKAFSDTFFMLLWPLIPATDSRESEFLSCVVKFLHHARAFTCVVVFEVTLSRALGRALRPS